MTCFNDFGTLYQSISDASLRVYRLFGIILYIV